MNKLGVSQDEIELIENSLYEYKKNLLSEKITFNETEFNLEYLIKLHKFLFDDLYYNVNISSRFNAEDINYINNKIKELVFLIRYEIDKELLENYIEDIKNIQIFDNGNKRTIDLFIEHICKQFNYDLKLGKYYRS